MNAMSTRKHGATADAPSAPVVAWRTERLIAAGLPAALAPSISADRGYDLHALLSLVDYGYPAELAARILAPLKETSRAS
jgi:hypothetical protein